MFVIIDNFYLYENNIFDLIIYVILFIIVSMFILTKFVRPILSLLLSRNETTYKYIVSHIRCTYLDVMEVY